MSTFKRSFLNSRLLRAVPLGVMGLLAACGGEKRTAIVVSYDVAETFDLATDWKLIVGSETDWADTSDSSFANWVQGDGAGGTDALEYAVTLDTLEYLRRGGRMTRGQEWLGTLLKVKPVLSIQNGEVVPVGRVRTRQRAIEDIIARCADLRPVEHLFVLHSTTPEESDYVRDRVAALDATAPITIGRVTPVVGVHGGPGIFGVGVVTAPDAQTAALGGK